MDLSLFVSIPLALGLAFSLYWLLRRRSVPEHTCLLIGLVAAVPAWSLAYWLMRSLAP